MEDGGGWGFAAGGEGILAPMEYEWGNGGRQGTKGNNVSVWDALVGGRTVISGVPNVGRIDFSRAHGCLGTHGV